METVKQVIEEEPVSPSRVQYRVPRDLETICLKCLQKEPRKRYATAKDMADDLNRYLVGEPIKARRTPPLERGVKWAKRHPADATAAGLRDPGGRSACLAPACGTGTTSGPWNESPQRHVAQLREETANDLIRAQEAMAKNDLNRGHEVLTTRKHILERENKPRAREPLRADQADARGGREGPGSGACAAGRATGEGRGPEALSSLPRSPQGGALPRHAVHRPHARRRTSSSPARRPKRPSASSHSRRHRMTGSSAIFPRSLSSEQQAEVREGCYELLLVLAEAVAAQDTGQVDRALRDPRKRRPTEARAFACLPPEEGVVAWRAKNDRAGEARELAEAERVRPETAFDYFLSGQQEYKRHRCADAIQDFEIALRKKPDHFWAKCLQAICYHPDDPVRSGEVELDRLPPDRPRLRLALSPARLRQRPDRRQVSRPGQRAVRARGEPEASRLSTSSTRPRRISRRPSSDSKRTPDDDLHYMLLVNRGLIRFQRGRLDQAAADYQEAIRLKKDPFLPTPSSLMSIRSKARPTEAIEQFTQAIALKPDWAPLYRGRAELLQDRARFDPRGSRRRPWSDLKMAILHEKDRQSGPGPGPHQSGQTALSRRAIRRGTRGKQARPAKSSPTMSTLRSFRFRSCSS